MSYVHEWALALEPQYTVVVGPRGCGKTIFAKANYRTIRQPHQIDFTDTPSVYDWPGGDTIPELKQLLLGLTRTFTQVAKSHYPTWYFKVFVREEDWLRVKGYVPWLTPYFLTAFPTHRLGVTPEDVFGYASTAKDPWAPFRDVRSRVLPGMVQYAAALRERHPETPTRQLLSQAFMLWLDGYPELRDLVVTGYFRAFQRRHVLTRRFREAGLSKDGLWFLEAIGAGTPVAGLKWRWGRAYRHVVNDDTKYL